MDDGVVLGTTLYLPDGTPPAAGWPGIVMLHGLGGSRQDTNTWAEQYFVPQGYAVLTYDARGHGASGGLVGIAGPREIADLRAIFGLFAARPDVDDARIGAWGISYGGGETWLGAAAGIPFAAIETVEAWTDLYGALFPQNLSKSGVVGGFLNKIAPGKLDPQYAFLSSDALHSTNLQRIRDLAAARSSLPQLGSLTTPVFMLQGRRDFAFGLDQAFQAYARLRGPKRLYIGDHGHPPSTFPAPDTAYAMTEAREWFDRFLRGVPNGIDKRPPVELASDPWKGKTASYAALPPTKTLSFPTKGKRTIGAEGVVVRKLGKTTQPLEELGSPTVTATVTPNADWTRIVAVLTAGTTVVSAGGVPARGGKVTIRMIDDATFVPKGSVLRLWIAGSTAHTPAGLLYLDLPMAAGAKLTVRDATLEVPVLAKPVSG
jgi:ABC-2 type transport system ATP-binding protein